MNHNQTYRFWRSAAQCLLGGIAVALVTFVCFRLNFSITTAALLYLIVVVLASLTGSFVLSTVVSIAAILCLDYFFTEPRFNIDVTLHQPLNLVVLITFLGTALVITSLMSRVRKSFQETQALKDQFRLVIDTIPGPVWSALPDGSRDFFNQRWLEYTGLSLEEGLGQGWQAAIHPEDRAKFLDESRAAMVAGQPLEAETRLRRGDGEYRWFLLRAVPLRDKLGNIVKWYGTSTDIEDRKRAEEVLREQARLLDLTHDTVFVRDMNDVITYWNRGAAELYGWTREEAVGKVSHQLMQTIFPAPVEEINAELLRTGRWEGELVHTKRDGTQVIVASRWSMQQDEQGRPLATLETNNDITERKRAEEEVRKQAELLGLAHDAIFVRDLESRVIFWNQGAENTYGWTAEEAIGRVTHELLQTKFAVSLEAVDVALREKGEWEGELTHITRKGTAIVVTSRQSLRRDERGAAAAILEINRDVTESKRAEEALHRAQAELAHVARVATLGEMTASISHEINQPLAAVVNNASACLRWLAASNLEEARQSAALVIADGHRAGEIIGRIRALAKKSPPRKDWLDINETILEVTALARSEVLRYRVSLETRLADDVPLILGDRIQLQQVILNLVMNGIEAMSAVTDRSRELLIRSVQLESDKVFVAVQDSGIGLQPESLDHLFTAFFTTKPQGMGMGLAISRSIIENHGGRLWATANEGRGATFQFTLPTGGGNQHD